MTALAPGIRLLWLAWLAPLAVAGAALAQTPGEARGLDVAILVDVSSSMFRSGTRERPLPGTDRERIRWEAVKLAADLLTVEDRLLVQRFNHACPPQFALPAFLDPEGRVPFRTTDDFRDRLAFLTAPERSDLEKRVALFNTTRDWQGSLDQGETGIVHALEVIAARLGRPAPGRRTHVVLLTDGLDSHYERYATPESLRHALRSYTGDVGGREPIPIHTIGLGLSPGGPRLAAHAPAGGDALPTSCESEAAGQPLDEGRKAEQFLLRISALTGGNYYPAQTNGDLIRIFLSLVRDLKGAWFQRHPFAAAPAGQTRTLDPTPVRGIVDLGVLAFETDPTAENPKKATAPLLRPPRFQWLGLERQPPPVAVRRTGKDGAGYEYHYFGKATLAETEKSPFAELPPAARLTLAIESSGRPQDLIFVKKTQESLFAVVRPEEGAKFLRQQALAIELAMAESAYFRADQFEVTARLLCAEDAARAETAQPLVAVPLRMIAGSRRFAGAIALGKLSASPAPIDYYTLSITVRGAPHAEHGLGGFQLNLPPRTIAVENTLALDPVPPIELTNDQPNALIPLTAAHDDPALLASFDNLSLQARFEPFRRDGRPIDLPGFALFDYDYAAKRRGADRVVSLRQGRGGLGLGFPKGATLPEGGVAYRPGKVVITGGDGVRMEPLEIEVRLRLALATVAVEPGDLRLKAQPQPTASPAARVVLAPPSQAPSGVGQVRLELRRATNSTGADGTFSAEELWLQPASAAPVEPHLRSPTLEVNLGDAFQVYVHPQQAHAPGAYRYEIAISGRGIDDARAPVIVSLDAPTLEARASQATVYVDPGDEATGTFELRLQGVATEALPAFVRGARDQSTSLFTDPTGKQPALSVRVATHDERSPLMLPAPNREGAPWVALPIRVKAPSEARFGRYQAQFAVGSDKTEDLVLTLELVVNSLVIETSATDDAGRSSWRAADEVPMLQFLGHDMEKTFRVRMGLEEPLSPQHIEVTPLRPFADESGDAQRPPLVAAVERAPSGKELLVTMRFPRTPNAHVELPYWVRVEVRSLAMPLKPAVAAFRVRFWNPLDFFAPPPGLTTTSGLEALPH